MADIEANNLTGAALMGRVSAYTVPGHIPESLVLDYEATPVFEGKNMVVAGAQGVVAALLRGDVENKLPSYISIGSGGDLDQDTRLDTGARVGPAVTDTSLRRTSYRIPIVTTEDGVSAVNWKYVAVARPHEALSPVLNEFGVETEDGTLISHYVTAAAADGRATQYCKTSLEYLVIKWEFTLNLVANGIVVESTTAAGIYLSTITKDGVVRAASIPGVQNLLGTGSTEFFIPIILTDGTTVAGLQIDNTDPQNPTITITDPAGGQQTLALVVVE